MKNKNLRIIVLLLIIASFFNISFNKSETKNSTIFLVDRSLSVNNSKVEIEDFINEKIKTKTKNDFYSVISFGENINTDISFTNIEKELIFYDNIDNTQTDIVNAINIAIAKFPQDSNKQIVLITDGNNNSGNSINEIELDDIEIKILKLDKDMVKEVMVSDVLLPDNLSVNEQFNLEIKIESNIKTKGKLKVYNNRNLISEKIILIENGINNYVMKDKISKSGFVNYKIEVVPEIDTYISNNVFTINTEIFGNKNILIVNGESNESINMEMITSQMEVNSIMINASEVPITLSELNKYSTIILNDVSLENLNSLFINNLSIYVEKMGGGLLVTGGKNSFALGGYYKSKLEKILPVDMEMKIDGEVPDLSLLIIIDKSGSMSGIKLSSAKEAARLALDSLKIDDKIAIVSFDSVPTVELELVNHNEKDKVINSINGIAMGGGTSIIPALEKGYEIIKDSDTKLKHVILITDGMAEQRGYDSVLNEYSNENITITTIGIGRESDQRTLGMIAEDTDGRFYLVEDYHLITKIFSKETFLASKSYLNNEIFFPIATSNSEILRNITKLPSLNGYISSTIKPTATMILASENLEPILSTMRVGNGKTIAWCSDISGFWTSDFINTVEGQQVIKNALKYIFKDLNDNFLISEETNGNSIKFIVKSNSEGLNNYLVIEDFVSNEIKEFELIKPSIFQIELNDLEVGTKGFRIIEYGENNNIINEKIIFKSINYSKEYNIFDNESIIEDLLLLGNVSIIEKKAEIFNLKNDNNSSKTSISKYFIIFAIIIFVIEIANRKLLIFKSFSKDKFKSGTKVKLKQKKLEKIVEKDNELEIDSGRLLKNKKNIKR